jgi:hypothetical protein
MKTIFSRASLSFAEQRSLGRAKPVRVDYIESGAHLGIARDVLDLEDGPEIMLFSDSASIKGLRFILHLFGVNVHGPAKFLSFRELSPWPFEWSVVDRRLKKVFAMIIVRVSAQESMLEPTSHGGCTYPDSDCHFIHGKHTLLAQAIVTAFQLVDCSDLPDDSGAEGFPFSRL